MEQGFHVGGATAVAAVVESVQIYFATRVAYQVPLYLTLTATIMELKVWTDFFWYEGKNWVRGFVLR
jgi:hypothetical protein